ncbi:atrial natriuretic peptide receptor 1-like [Paramacrobiotus metropolitanus]|uniref:atrial natriuretic peptide receptor 1-like n=1 Tax=Paramacrobiotus metropolitanus TaxID=2943436 RepID=UPI0024457A38|nr:atrial natriuretic peptide receptor 1-like [Paramacrobiotus metropolitanus]
MPHNMRLNCSRTPLQIEIITMAVMYTTQLGGWPYTGPAFQYALDEVARTYPCLNISQKLLYDYRYQTCLDWSTENVNVMAAYVLDKRRPVSDITAFVLPGCSMDVFPVVPVITEWDLFMITSVGITPQIWDKVAYPTWITAAISSLIIYRETCLVLMRQFQWETFSIVHNTAANSVYATLANLFKTAIEGHPGTQLHLIKVDDNYYESPGYYENVLQELNRHSRVYFIFGLGLTGFRKFMLAASKLNMTNGEHVFITVIPFRNGMSGFDIHWKFNDTVDDAARSAFRSVLVMEPDESAYGERNVAAQHEFANLMIRSSKTLYNYTYLPGERVSPYVMATYDSVIIFAQVMNEIFLSSASPINGSGRSLAKHFLSRTFETTYTNVTFDGFGQRLFPMLLKQFDWSSGILRDAIKFEPNGDNGTEISPFQWPTTWPPPDEPECGFRRDRSACLTDSSGPVVIGSVVAAVSLVCFVVLLTLYRCRKLQNKDSNSKWWLLNPQHLHRKIRDSTDKNSVSGEEASFGDESVWLTPVSAGDEHLEIPLEQTSRHRTLLKTLHELKSMDSSNVNRFLGICCTFEQKVFFVSAHCERGSLEDLMKSRRIDNDLRLSFIYDLLQGVLAVSRSSFKSHGSLKIHKCLVDNRFTLKLGSLAFLRLRSSFVNSNNHSSVNTTAKIRDFAPDLPAAGLIVGHIVLQNEIPPEALLQICSNSSSISEAKIPLLKIIIPVIKECLTCTNPNDKSAAESVIKTFKKATGRKHNENMMERIAKRLERYTAQLDTLVAERTAELSAEKAQCESLLMEMFPKEIIPDLRKGCVINPETFESVTVMFSDIAGFGHYVQEHGPSEVMTFLNQAYSVFDLIVPRFDAYKVETIKDSYMVVSGLPKRNGIHHAKELCLLAQALIRSYSQFGSATETSLRVGMHSGSCAAGVVGNKVPRYCLFGDTINTASRMLMYSESSHIHMSCATADLVADVAEFVLKERGFMDVKGKGSIRTFWLKLDHYVAADRFSYFHKA